ncbi:MAG: hypothetical protein A07HR60_01145, partial [uncultured archaeon A07HR60]
MFQRVTRCGIRPSSGVGIRPEAPNVADWQLLGYAAAIGHELGKDQEAVIEDL